LEQRSSHEAVDLSKFRWWLVNSKNRYQSVTDIDVKGDDDWFNE